VKYGKNTETVFSMLHGGEMLDDILRSDIDRFSKMLAARVYVHRREVRFPTAQILALMTIAQRTTYLRSLARLAESRESRLN
jgi:hypothetical protein